MRFKFGIGWRIAIFKAPRKRGSKCLAGQGVQNWHLIHTSSGIRKEYLRQISKLRSPFGEDPSVIYRCAHLCIHMTNGNIWSTHMINALSCPFLRWKSFFFFGLAERKRRIDAWIWLRLNVRDDFELLAKELTACIAWLGSLCPRRSRDYINNAVYCFSSISDINFIIYSSTDEK